MQTTFEFNQPLPPVVLSPTEQEAHDRAIAQSKNFKKAETDLLQAIDDVFRLGVYLRLHQRSLYDYCIEYLELTNHQAYYFVAVAERSRQIPELREAIMSGETTVSKAAKAMSVMTKENAPEWIEKVSTLTCRALEKEVVKARPGDARKASVKPIAPNITRVSFDADDEAIFMLERAKVVAKTSDTGRAVKEALKEYLHRKDPLKKAERAQNREARPERREYVPARSRHAVNLRDKGCCQQVINEEGQICGHSKFTQIHHIVKRSDGGSHDPANLITLCSLHHSLQHEDEEYTV